MNTEPFCDLGNIAAKMWSVGLGPEDCIALYNEARRLETLVAAARDAIAEITCPFMAQTPGEAMAEMNRRCNLPSVHAVILQARRTK